MPPLGIIFPDAKGTADQREKFRLTKVYFMKESDLAVQLLALRTDNISQGLARL